MHVATIRPLIRIFFLVGGMSPHGVTGHLSQANITTLYQSLKITDDPHFDLSFIRDHFESLGSLIGKRTLTDYYP